MGKNSPERTAGPSARPAPLRDSTADADLLAARPAADGRARHRPRRGRPADGAVPQSAPVHPRAAPLHAPATASARSHRRARELLEPCAAAAAGAGSPSSSPPRGRDADVQGAARGFLAARGGTEPAARGAARSSPSCHRFAFYDELAAAERRHGIEPRRPARERRLARVLRLFLETRGSATPRCPRV